jgi:predicted Zn-dependent peptidase
MVNYERFVLENGLVVLVHEDNTTPMAVMNILYDVGARDEDESKTGFAHLFEHLMFEGSKNIPNYDGPLQKAGGSNNAFTSNDITNYYLTVPAQNIETGFWLESDRMLELAFLQEKLDIQKKVVIEEYKQRYLNQPYGDVWLLLRPLVYKKHPYLWPTIGKEIQHIEDATLEDVRQFFFTHYAPNNANLVVAGNVTVAQVKELAQKWFGAIPARQVPQRKLPVEPPQEEERRLKVERDVPADMLVMAFHMPERNHPDYLVYDLITDILSSGHTCRLYQQLVKEKQMFTDIGAYVMGSYDPGLLVVSGKLDKRYTMAEGEKAIWEVLDELKARLIPDAELQKVKNKLDTREKFSLMNILNIAQKLATSELLGNANIINTELEDYNKVTAQDVQRISQLVFRKENAGILEYQAQKK